MAPLTVTRLENWALRSAGCLVSAVLLPGYGGSGTSGTTDALVQLNPPEAEIKNGVFRDANVRGLTVAAGATTSVTDPRGRFTCKIGERLAFSVGAVRLGETECTTLVHPEMLSATARSTIPRRSTWRAS
jgi:hypothetical protein